MSDITRKIIRGLVSILMIALYVKNVTSFEELFELKNLIAGLFYLIAFAVFIKADIAFYKKLQSK